MTGPRLWKMTALTLTALLLLILCTGTGSAAERKRLMEEYTISSDGKVGGWTEYTYTAQGHRIETEHDGWWKTRISEYNESGKIIKESYYVKKRETGENTLFSDTEYIYTADDKLACRHSISYSTGDHSYEYHDFDSAGREVGMRHVVAGEELSHTRREYNADGSYIVKSYFKESLSTEEWYNEYGLITRNIHYNEDGSIIPYNYATYEYILDANGKVLQKITNSNNIKTIERYERNERGVETRRETITDSGSSYYHEAYDHQFDARGRQISTTYTTYDRNGNIENSYLQEEFEYDENGQFGYIRTYSQYFSTLDLNYTRYFVYQDPSGIRPELASPPRKNDSRPLYLDNDICLAELRGLTRADVVSRYYGRQLSECIYDADATVYYYDVPGSLRFVFNRRDSDHLLYAFWYSEDFYSDMLMEVSNVLSYNGYDFDRGSNEPNCLGFYEETATYDGGGRITLAYLAEEVDNVTCPTYLCFAYPQEPRGQYSAAPVTTAVPAPTSARTYTPAPTATPAPLPISTAYNDRWTHVWKRVGEPDTELIISENPDGSLHAEMFFYRMGAFESDFLAFEDPVADFFITDSDMGGMLELSPDGSLRLYMMSIAQDDFFYEYFTENEFIFTLDEEPAAGSDHADPDEANESAEWDGYWMTIDDSQGELAITAHADGSVTLAVSFLRTLSFETDAVPDGNFLEFSTQNGEFAGSIVRANNNILLFSVSDGYILDPESEYASFFQDRVFDFHPAAYEDLYYISPDDRTAYDTGWTGHWASIGGDYESHLYITEDDQGNYVPTFTFDTGHTFTGSSSQYEENVIDLITDEFGCMLTLNPKRGIILVTEPYTTVDAVNDWLDAHSRVIDYEWVDAGSAPQNGSTKTEPLAAPGRGTVTPAPTIPAAGANTLPIPGKPGCLQVPVARVSATSWIESQKDPSAFLPERMIDGDETTSYQFSAKVTKPGQAFLYFEFNEPVELDELWIKNGFWKITDGKDQYTRNSRIKKMSVEYFTAQGGYQKGQSYTLKDDKARKDWTVLSLGRRTGVTGVRVRVDSIYTGSKYKNDVCVSEVMFVVKK